MARDPAVYLALALADSGPYVERAAADHAAGARQVGAITHFGLEAGDSLRLVLGADVSAEERRVLDDWSARLARGEIEAARDDTGREFDPRLALA